jgi:NifU-like protein
MAWDYTDLVKEHFFSPRNVGKIESPDGVGEVGSIACGDALSLTLKVDKSTGRIEDVKFQTFGCGSAIASSSILTEMVKGKTLDEALAITNQDIAAALGGLPAEKMHCSVMGREALEAAINDYRGVAAAADEDRDEGRIICNCFGVAEGKIRRVIREDNLRTVEDVTNYTKAGGGCGSCIAQIEEILEDELGKKAAAEAAAQPARKRARTNLERINLIQEVLDNEVRPLLQKDSGDLDLVDIDGHRVIVRLVGHCAGCRAAGLTTGWIEDKLREIVDPNISLEVVEE